MPIRLLDIPLPIILPIVAQSVLAQVAVETKKLTEMLAWRDDDGMERFPLAAKHAKESKELLEEILKVQASQERHLDKIAQHLARTT